TGPRSNTHDRHQLLVVVPELSSGAGDELDWYRCARGNRRQKQATGQAGLSQATDGADAKPGSDEADGRHPDDRPDGPVQRSRGYSVAPADATNQQSQPDDRASKRTYR